MTIHQTFHDIVSGRRRGPQGFLARILLGAAEIPYRAAVGVRNHRYDNSHAKIHRVEVPVISVGNLTLGGTGKTPMVAWLARWFRDRNLRVSIVSRGYGAEADGQNDEARELEQQLPDVPHLQNPDRVAAARIAIDELETQVILLDDGFQHRRLARDLDIVLLDATEPFGHDHVFPRGLLREPASGLARAHCVALTRADMISRERINEIRTSVERHAPHATWVEMAHAPFQLLNSTGSTAELPTLVDHPVAAFCGIGNPEGFRHTLQECQYEIADLKSFPDHHSYQAEDIAALQSWVTEIKRRRSKLAAVVCTHKDLVKLAANAISNVPLWAVTVRMQLRAGEDSLSRQLEQFCQD